MTAIMQRISELLRLTRLEKRWQKLARVLAIFVVFCTTYMLILPAITMESLTYCGMSEHTHKFSCYLDDTVLICGVKEHKHNEGCFIAPLVTNGNVTDGNVTDGNIAEEAQPNSDKGFLFSLFSLGGDEDEIKSSDEGEASLLSDTADDAYGTDAGTDYSPVVLAATNEYGSVTSYDSLDGSGESCYIVYTYLDGSYYALDGDGNALPVTVSGNTVTPSTMSDDLLWTFSLQSGTSYIIQNKGTSRYMHSYNNGGTNYGVTTSGRYTSSLESVSDGTFRVKSNSNYSRIVSSSGSAVFQTTTSSSSAAKFYIAYVYIPQDVYHVWFDGTCGGLMSLYESDNTYLAVPGTENTITLPATWTSPSKYDYTLNGWYDIKNNILYSPGATVTITNNTVFYADWVASSYDVGIVNEDNISRLAHSIDTDTFIRTDMFDYSAIFNMQAVRHTGTVSASSHSENWTIVQNGTVPYNNMDSLGFIFRDWDQSDKHISFPANRARLNNNIGTEITSEIVDYVYGMSGRDIIDMLFTPETEVIGKNYVGRANYLYQFMEKGSANYDGEHDGYYYYDSKLNAASYNQTEQRFYIYNYLERTSDSLKDGFDSNGAPTAGGAYSDFLPFNSPYVNNSNNKIIVEYEDADGNGPNYQYDAKATNQSSAIENAGTNYWFGMKSEIEFYLPDATGTVDAYQNYGNISSHGQHMTFEFSGDDDLWVFIDGELVMDIGGLHGIMEGEIDFSTGIITTSTANDVNESGTAATVEKTFMPPIPAGDHTLTVYYMERGGSQSNCAIYFNITPRYSMELVKQDSLSGNGLDGAVFEVFTDIGCTEAALLWTSETAYQNDVPATNRFEAVDGKVDIWGISAGKVYYIKEVAAPPGYPQTDDIIRVSMNNLGNSICSVDALRGEDGFHTDGFEIIHNTADEAHQQVAVSVANQTDTSDKRNVAVTKNWNVDDATLIPESVTMYLLANGLNTGKSAELNEVNNWTYVWIDLPIYDSNGDVIQYSVYEEQAEDFYADVEVSDEGVYINAWVQTDSFYDGGTFLIVNRETDRALSVNTATDEFVWIDMETAMDTPAAHWIVNADGMGFHVIDENGYHIILDGTNEFIPQLNGNRILYFHNFGLAARYNNTYYYLDSNFSASTNSNLDIKLYINKDILIHEDDILEEDMDDVIVDGEDTVLDDKIFVTQYTVTNTQIEEDNRTSFAVEKLWEDGAINHIQDKITVHLYANGADTGRSLVLNNANNWKGSFEGLLYNDASGNKIEYTVTEDNVKGYYSEYSEITLTEGSTQNVTVWHEVSSLEEGGVYMFISNGRALASNSNNAVVSATVNEDDDYQKWRVINYNNNLKLQNVGNSRYLYYRYSLTTNTSYTNNYANVSLSGSRLRIGSSTRYITLGTSVSTTTSSGSATTFTVMKAETVVQTNPPTYSVIITNKKEYYPLPETGGTGVYHMYITGGLLMFLSVVFLLSKHKSTRKRRSDFSGA